jgi:uncharacterized damage-inducible protein DinB
MYHKIDDVIDDCKIINEGTIKMFKALDDNSLEQKVTPDGRSLGYLAWHIVITLGEMGNKAGLQVVSVPEESDAPATAKEILTAYEKSSVSLQVQLMKKWTDQMLSEEIEMYGQKWKRGTMLSALLSHEIHHRGQMTVLMRQAGLKVPGVCGPSKEEWAQFGMQAPK